MPVWFFFRLPYLIKSNVLHVSNFILFNFIHNFYLIDIFGSFECKLKAYCLHLFQFCQPGGWQASYVYHDPTYYYAILTDVEGTHSYCGCLLFYEPVLSKKTRPGSQRRKSSSTEGQAKAPDEEDIEEHREMTYYVPKCLCLVTRQKHLDTLKVPFFMSYYS